MLSNYLYKTRSCIKAVNLLTSPHLLTILNKTTDLLSHAGLTVRMLSFLGKSTEDWLKSFSVFRLLILQGLQIIRKMKLAEIL